ncbi:MAG: BrxA/BrxB family bacilliredoxin [Gemmatimonadales bacterium]
MRYDPRLVQPMREELTGIGFEEMLTPQEAEAVLQSNEGTLLVVVNSVCGCAAGKARPGVTRALQNDKKPERLATVFAGMEIDATDKVRGYFPGYQPSSPQIALFKSGTLVHMLERHDIEGRGAEEIAADLSAAFDKHCG